MFALTCALVVVMATVCNAGLVTLTAVQKQAILDAHNRLRAQTAQGLTGSQPGAANMPVLEWDDRLMVSASNWVQGCTIGHDSNRVLPNYSWVGQNWAGGSSSNFSSFVQLWFNEYTDFNYDSNSCRTGAVCGHYTQVVWAKTTLVGCGAAQCPNVPSKSYPYHFVCNYAMGGNYNGESPYAKGSAGSQCGADYSFKQRGLCLRKDQCTGSDCTCTLSSCTNGGTVDSTNCRCNCTAGFYGDKCENTCQDTATDLCDYYKKDICVYTDYAPQCAVTCDLCKPTVLRDPSVVNTDGVKARSP